MQHGDASTSWGFFFFFFFFLDEESDIFNELSFGRAGSQS